MPSSLGAAAAPAFGRAPEKDVDLLKDMGPFGEYGERGIDSKSSQDEASSREMREKSMGVPPVLALRRKHRDVD